MDKLRNNIFALKWMFQIAPGYTTHLIVDKIFGGLMVLFEHTYLVAYIIDCIENQRTFEDVLKFLLPLTCVIVINFFRLHLVWCYLYPKPLAKIKREIQLTLYQKAISMDISKYDNSEFYNDFVWAMQKAPEHIMASVESFGSLLAEVIVALVAGAFIVSYDSMALIVVVIVLAITMLSQTLINKFRIKREEEAIPHTRRRDYINRVYYLSDYVKDLKMSDMSDRLENDFESASEGIKKVTKSWSPKLIALETSISGVNNIIYSGMYLSYLFYKALMLNMFGVGVLLAVYNSTNRLKRSLSTITERIIKLQEHGMYIEKLRTFLDTENELVDGVKDVPEGGDFSLEHVQFAYDGNDEPTLQDVSIQIKQGEKIALVGFNGAGKSTLIKLLLRLYDPDAGQILYAGKIVREYKLSEYRAMFGTLFQDFEIFATDIAGNIGMQDEAVEIERANEAMEKAGFWERFCEMPYGYETQLTKEFAEDGVSLSGGESQKLALARVLYANSSVIVLDEPSSALDPIAEYQLNKTITEMSAEKTVIIISHRLSTTRFVDKIYMMENGRIQESGTHDELIQKNGVYAKMFWLQAEKYR